MFTKIKEFLFGKPAEVAEAPYKVEVTAPKVEVVPVGTEASVAAVPVEEKPTALAEPVAEKKPAALKTPVKPKAPPKSKAPPKPRAPRKPVSK